MTKEIRDISATFKPIRDTSATLPRVEPSQVAAALGAVPAGEGLKKSLAPITLFAVRQELFRRLQASSSRPGLPDTARRQELSLSGQEWARLEQLAATIAASGFTPSAGQVASVLLTLSLETVAKELAAQPVGSPLVRELAERAAGKVAADGASDTQ